MLRLRLSDGETLRRLSIDEAARLQSFPASFNFAEEVIMERMAYVGIGNAVAPELGRHLSQHVREFVQTARLHFDLLERRL